MGWPEKEAVVEALGLASPQQPGKILKVELLGIQGRAQLEAGRCCSEGPDAGGEALRHRHHAEGRAGVDSGAGVCRFVRCLTPAVSSLWMRWRGLPFGLRCAQIRRPSLPRDARRRLGSGDGQLRHLHRQSRQIRFADGVHIGVRHGIHEVDGVGNSVFHRELDACSSRSPARGKA